MKATEIIANISAAPANVIKLNTNHVINKQILLNALAEACHFPHYFGYNWDAAWECLSDNSTHDLLLDLTSAKSIDETELAIFIDIISKAYTQYGSPKLWIIAPNTSLYCENN